MRYMIPRMRHGQIVQIKSARPARRHGIVERVTRSFAALRTLTWMQDDGQRPRPLQLARERVAGVHARANRTRRRAAHHAAPLSDFNEIGVWWRTRSTPNAAATTDIAPRAVCAPGTEG